MVGISSQSRSNVNDVLLGRTPSAMARLDQAISENQRSAPRSSANDGLRERKDRSESPKPQLKEKRIHPPPPVLPEEQPFTSCREININQLPQPAATAAAASASEYQDRNHQVPYKEPVREALVAAGTEPPGAQTDLTQTLNVNPPPTAVHSSNTYNSGSVKQRTEQFTKSYGGGQNSDSDGSQYGRATSVTRRRSQQDTENAASALHQLRFTRQ